MRKLITGVLLFALSAFVFGAGFPPPPLFLPNTLGVPLDVSTAGSAISVSGAIDVRAAGAKCDGKAVYDATTTASTTTTISSATAAFKAADVGKVIAVMPYADTANPVYGTVASVISATQITASVNSAPAALTNAIVVWGTDDTAKINTALSAAKYTIGAVQIPGGICTVIGSLTIPVGVTLRGVANFSTGGKAKDFKYSGSSIVAVRFNAASLLIIGDSTSTDPKGTTVRDINIDAFGLAYHAYDGSTTSRTGQIASATFLRGVGETIWLTPTANMHDSAAFGSNNAANVVQAQGDGRIINNIITGSGNGFYQLKLSNSDDLIISMNHMWKDSNLATSLGGQIFVSQNSGNVTSGSVTIALNKFDTSYGPHVFIKVSGNSTLRGLNLESNHGFQNDNVTTATYPFFALEVDAGSSLRVLNIHNNMGHASWNGTVLGSLTYFIDGGLGVAGTFVGIDISGNQVDNCAASYNVFAPTALQSHNNNYIVGSGTVATPF